METLIRKPLILVILDGWGFSQKTVGNPVKKAKLPNLDFVSDHYPMVLIQASGPAVGMAWGETGNSEVGHLNIGAGRIIEQYYSRINRAVKDGSFFENPAILGAFNHAQQQNSKVHIIGLLTSGTVHAAFNHLLALIKMAAKQNRPDVYLHLFLDGKDSGLQEGAELLAKLADEIQKIGSGKIATIIGRDLGMDRDNHWDRTQKAYELIALGQGEQSDNLKSTVSTYYQQGLNDTNLPPVVLKSSAFRGIADGDSLIFFNFREDSMRQITKSFINQDLPSIKLKPIKNIYVATMTQYLDPQTDSGGKFPQIAFLPPRIPNCLAEVISKHGKNQMHIAETEKYSHVTYFFNGLQATAFSGESDIFIDSVKDIQKNPEMASAKITAKIKEALDQNLYDFIVLNFANADLLAHTGNFEAAVLGIEAIDRTLGQIQEKILEKNGVMVITADHGNVESMIYRSGGEAETRHDDNPVFFYLVANEYHRLKDEATKINEISAVNGILADIAPTVLELLGLPQPPEMTGQSLLPILTKSRFGE